MTYFPFFTNIDNKTFLVVGGSSVAHRKVQRLLTFTSRILVIAEETDITEVRVLRRPFSLPDLALGDFVIDATGDVALHGPIYDYCTAHRIPVNVVDQPALCTFIFPSIISRGDLNIAISTGGASPAYARLLRQQLEAELPAHVAGMLARMRALRQEVPSSIASGKERQRCYEEVLQLLLSTDNAANDAEVAAIVAAHAGKEKAGAGNAEAVQPCRGKRV